MNEDSQFENQLRRHALKPVPAEWREEIFAAAGGPVDQRPRAEGEHAAGFAVICGWLNAVLSSSPRAWAGLAAVWVVILGLNLAGGDEPAMARMTRPISPAQARMALEQRQQLMNELAGRPAPQPPLAPRATAPGPQSRRWTANWAA